MSKRSPKSRQALAVVSAALAASFPATAFAGQVEITGHITQVGVSQGFTVGETFTLGFEWVGPGPETSLGSGTFLQVGSNPGSPQAQSRR